MELPPPTDPHDERRRRFSSLMREHHRELLIFAGAVTRDRASAQDIVQDAFVSAWRKFGDYDEAGDFGAWMRGIVRNKIKDWFRVRQRQPVGISPEALEFVELEIDIAAWQVSTGKEDLPLSFSRANGGAPSCVPVSVCSTTTSLTRNSHTLSTATCCGHPVLRSGPNCPWAVSPHTALRKIRSAPHKGSSSLCLVTKGYEKCGLTPCRSSLA
jgi:RNA polymerase sigma factor (sigma-70 family)